MLAANWLDGDSIRCCSFTMWPTAANIDYITHWHTSWASWLVFNWVKASGSKVSSLRDWTEYYFRDIWLCQIFREQCSHMTAVELIERDMWGTWLSVSIRSGCYYPGWHLVYSNRQYFSNRHLSFMKQEQTTTWGCCIQFPNKIMKSPVTHWYLKLFVQVAEIVAQT